MAERGILPEQSGSQFIFTKVERLSRALRIGRHLCQSFIVGSFESGEFIRFRPIGKDSKRVRLAVSQVVDFVEKPPVFCPLKPETAYNLQGTEIGLKVFLSFYSGFSNFNFLIDAPKEVKIVREELVNWPQELPQLIENPSRELRGWFRFIRQLESLAIGDISQSNFLRLRMLTSNRGYVALALSEIVEGRESPTKVFWVRPDDAVYTLPAYQAYFKILRKGARRMEILIDAPRNVAIATEK